MVTVQVDEIWLWVFAVLITISAILRAIEAYQRWKLRWLQERLPRQGWGGHGPVTPPQLHDNQFLFTYPLMQNGARVAVLKGVCTVTDDSRIAIELYEYESPSETTVALEPIMEVQIRNWLRREMDHELGVAHQISRSNRVAYNHAVARGSSQRDEGP